MTVLIKERRCSHIWDIYCLIVIKWRWTILKEWSAGNWSTESDFEILIVCILALYLKWFTSLAFVFSISMYVFYSRRAAKMQELSLSHWKNVEPFLHSFLFFRFPKTSNLISFPSSVLLKVIYLSPFQFPSCFWFDSLWNKVFVLAFIDKLELLLCS